LFQKSRNVWRTNGAGDGGDPAEQNVGEPADGRTAGEPISKTARGDSPEREMIERGIEARASVVPCCSGIDAGIRFFIRAISTPVGTFALARFAFQAEVQNGIKRRVVRPIDPSWPEMANRSTFARRSGIVLVARGISTGT